MKKTLQILSVVALLTWGGLFLYYYAGGRIDKFLDPSFRIYALLSGIGMLLLGSFNFLNRNRAVGLCTHDHAHGDACEHDHHHDHVQNEHSHAEHDHADCDHDHKHGEHEGCDHDHDHSHADSHDHDHSHGHSHEDSTSGVVFSLIVLIIPMAFATAYSQDRFSTEYLMKWGKIERQMMQMRIAERQEKEANDVGSVGAATNPYTREGIEGEGPTDADTPPEPKTEGEAEENASWDTFTIEDLKQMVPQNDKGEFMLDVPQIFYTAGDKELMEVMEGIPVETTAQLMEETLNNPNNTRLKAFRLFIECCAADARPLSIPVDFGKTPPPYTEMGWYRLYGKLHYSREGGEILPIIEIERIEETVEPTDGLLF